MSNSIRRWQVVSTVTIAALSVLSTLLGLFRPGHYPPELLPEFAFQDLTILVVGVPALLLSLRAARAGSLRARVVWLGALAYAAYLWFTIAIQVPFNRFFLGYVLLFGLSLFTFVGGVVATDAEAVRRSLDGRLSASRYGAVLLFVAAGLAVLWLSELVPATLTGTPPPLVEEMGPQALVSHFVDLSVVVPGLALAGYWLRQRRQWGYALAGVGLAFGALLAPTITGMTVVLVATGGVTIPPVAILFTALPAVVAVAAAVGFLRAMDGVTVAAAGVSGESPG